MEKQNKIIVLTGAESTGKSTLAQAIADHYNVGYLPELARDFVLGLNRPYTFEDVERIALKQVEQLNRARSSGQKLIVLDTWLIITKVWFDVVYKHIPEWLDKAICNTPVDLFLVCDTDLPWIADDVRENGGASRLKLQQKYIEEIKKYGYKWQLINGNNEHRLNKALSIIEKV